MIILIREAYAARKAEITGPPW